jgi:hypothetical protein
MGSFGGGWPWSGLIRSYAWAAPAVVVCRRSVDMCSGGDVARIKILEKKAGGCHLGSMWDDDFVRNQQLGRWVQSEAASGDYLGFVEATNLGFCPSSRFVPAYRPSFEWIEQSLGGRGGASSWWKGTASGDCRSFAHVV